MNDLKSIASSFGNYMCSKFGASVKHKEDAFEMKAVAWGMDLGRNFGVGGLASSSDFMTGYTTTIGTNIYMPKEHRDDPMTFIEVLTHECQHVVQFKESGIEFGWLYLTEAEARVKYEADAYAAGIAIQQWLTGSLPLNAGAGAVASLVAGYHLRAEDANLAEDMLKSHVASLKSGIVMVKSAREAISYLSQNFPTLHGSV